MCIVNQKLHLTFCGQSRARGRRGAKKSAAFSFHPLPATVAAATVNRDGGADCLARSKGLGFRLGDGDGLALDFGPSGQNMISRTSFGNIRASLWFDLLADSNSLSLGNSLCLSSEEHN